MRLYPPAVAIGRHAVESVPIGDTPVPRGALVFVLVYTMHRDARWFSDPERFDPGRFSAPREGSIPEHAYLPFGLGPRACIGRRFSMMEGPLVLAELVRQFQIRLSDGSEPELETQISLHPRGGVPLWLTARPEGAEVDR
jgi:cytochrome P450